MQMPFFFLWKTWVCFCKRKKSKIVDSSYFHFDAKTPVSLDYFSFWSAISTELYGFLLTELTEFQLLTLNRTVEKILRMIIGSFTHLYKFLWISIEWMTFLLDCYEIEWILYGFVLKIDLLHHQATECVSLYFILDLTSSTAAVLSLKRTTESV